MQPMSNRYNLHIFYAFTVFSLHIEATYRLTVNQYACFFIYINVSISHGKEMATCNLPPVDKWVRTFGSFER